MAREPKPWFRKDRQVCCVTVHGVRHVLGPNRKEAFDRFYSLMREPERRQQPVVLVLSGFATQTTRIEPSAIM